MIGIGTQEMARMHQEDLRRHAAVMRLAAARHGWRHTAGAALVRLGTRFSGPGPASTLTPALPPPGRACG